MSSIVKETINLAFICDDNYAIPTGVAISSLFEHRNPEREYNVFIIASKVSERRLQLLHSLNADNFKIIVFDSSNIASYESFKKMDYAMHVSSAALYKFNLPDVLCNLNKVLYLDGDILIRDSLEELYDMDIDGYYVAACKDVGAETWPAHYNKRLGINHSGYFNSGVMLLNLELLRKDDMPKKLLDYKINGKNDYMDQDAFNVVFSEKVKYISLLYNMGFSCWRHMKNEELCKYYEIESSSVEELYKKAKILHLSAPEKPWLYYDVPASEEWLVAYANSPFRALELHRTSNPKGMEKLTNGCDYEKIQYDRRLNYATKSPLISVISPVYNAAELLPTTIESLICQTFTDCEFIFVDDGSKDNSVKILKHYQKLDPRIKIYKQKNSYAGVARNNGISHAKGKYITFLDSDDIMIPDALNEFYWRAEHTDVVISSAYHFEKDVKKRMLADWCLRTQYLTSDKNISVKNHSRYIFQIAAGAPWGKFYRTDFIKENGICFPKAPRAEDMYFVYWSFAVAKSMAILNRKTILYRNDASSGSLENAKDKHPMAQIEVRQQLAEKLREIGVWDTVKQSFINNVINGESYHLRTFKTAKAFELVYNNFKNSTIPFYEIDMENPDYFYVKGEYEYMKEIYDSEDCISYIFNQMMKYKGQADRHWRALMRIKETQDLIAANNAENQDLITIYAGEADTIKKSWSYKIGRFITWLPRKFKGMIRCYKEHGLKYTCWRVLVNLHILRDPFKDED